MRQLEAVIAPPDEAVRIFLLQLDSTERARFHAEFL